MIRDVRMSDLGGYTCRVITPGGVAEATLMMTVLGMSRTD